MELRHLRTFVAVAEERHFGRAASRLYLSPPAVTAHVQALEHEVGTALFERTPRVTLTEAGNTLLGPAVRMLAAAVALRQVATSASRAVGELRVGVMSNGAGRATSEIIHKFMTAYPRVRVKIHRLDFTDHASALLEHRVDIAFLRPAPRNPRLSVVPLFGEPRVAVVPAGHQLAEAGALSVNDLLDLRFVGLAEATVPSFGDYLYLQASRNGTAARSSDDQCADVWDVLAAVAAGRGIATAVESFRDYAGWPNVSYVPICDAPTATNCLVSRIADRSAAVAAFAGLAQLTVATWGSRAD